MTCCCNGVSRLASNSNQGKIGCDLVKLTRNDATGKRGKQCCWYLCQDHGDGPRLAMIPTCAMARNTRTLSHSMRDHLINESPELVFVLWPHNNQELNSSAAEHKLHTVNYSNTPHDSLEFQCVNSNEHHNSQVPTSPCRRGWWLLTNRRPNVLKITSSS